MSEPKLDRGRVNIALKVVYTKYLAKVFKKENYFRACCDCRVTKLLCSIFARAARQLILVVYLVKDDHFGISRMITRIHVFLCNKLKFLLDIPATFGYLKFLRDLNNDTEAGINVS